MTKQYDIAVVGATGAVGETILKVLEERNFPVRNLYPLASSRSAGKKLEFNGGWVEIQDLATFDFSKVQIGLFSPGASVSREYAPKAAAAGCIVVDNTSEFRYDEDIPLVVPEVNPAAVAGYKNRGIIANPNCSTIQMMVALKPIYDAVGIERINVSTYQAVSGSGKEAIDELATQTANLLNMKPVETKVYPKQIAFNCIPQIDVFQENGYTKEEMKMVWETKKIMEDDSILVNPTAVRVPVFFGHSEAIHLETKEKITAEQAKELFRNFEGIVLIDEHVDGGYPTAVTDAANTNPVYVGRVREDISCDKGLNIWVVADNVRKGAATNTVQIAELLIKDHI
ncbi:aspartate-semialdehyde dehydrogenase [Hydrogenovibrio sp. 3SP14C1]|uniref:aspartate-semialdehyde dehydrogenase n=1 Tax=Hydrogenovibrio sp. 3SP14C1 TaxID=3038774 RepID=UPI002416432D|nr:aspartate-semialdehyde dehydrogenase [Hydrogenovibrio sp. 3SP14C1]MDG4813154.1 aspartate-semialdehyde dehydrogenase [Hydrogenovibrio sp. 3SP14C1]